MIVGNGLIAKAFDNFKDDQVIVFASGVSNSLEQRRQEFDREENLLRNVINENPEKKIVYFSTCYFNDIKKKKKYVIHKEKMENLLKNSNRYLIMRLPIVIGRNGNKNNFFNHICNSIKEKREITVYKNLKRSLIDIDDVVKYTNLIISKKKQNFIVNLSSKFSWSVDFLVREIAIIMNSKVNIKLIDGLSENEHIDTSLLQSLDNKKIVSDKYYYKKVLKKYLL